MVNEKLSLILRHIITEIHGIPASDTDIERVSTLMATLLDGIAKLKKLDFASVEAAGILQVKE